MKFKEINLLGHTFKIDFQKPGCFYAKRHKGGVKIYAKARREFIMLTQSEADALFAMPKMQGQAMRLPFLKQYEHCL